MSRRLLMVGGALAAAAGAYVGVVSGRVTVDLGWGRSRRPLGPLVVTIAAPREVVFDLIAAPYLGRTPTALAGKLQVLERGGDMVLAEHYTPVRGGLVATTVETVRFSRPERVSFRLVRGPVPFVEEEFLLQERDGATILRYQGELAADLWALGRWWGEVVGRRWDAAVAASLAAVGAEAERQAGARDAASRSRGR
jgi:hypothetical protein